MNKNDFRIILKNGRKLGYSEYGDLKGTPLFYFHGWPTSRLQAEGLDGVAKKLHARIIAVDRPGYGLSDFKRDRELLDWPKDVIELADYLKIKKFAVMGVSGGGPYATVCAYKIPNRITKTGIVVGLAPTYVPGLLDGTSFFAKLAWKNYSKFSLLRKAATLFHYFIAKYSPSLGLYSFLFGAKSDKKIYSNPKIRDITKRNYKEAFRTGYAGVELDLKLYTTDWKFNIKDIRAKVYLWYGEVDKNVSLNMGKYYAAQIPNSKLTVYPKEGHLILRAHAEEIIKTLMSLPAT